MGVWWGYLPTAGVSFRVKVVNRVIFFGTFRRLEHYGICGEILDTYIR